MSYTIVEKFLGDLKEEFGERDDETQKMAELKKIEQGGKMMEEFIQKFRRAARVSGYEERPLIEELK